MLQIGKLKRQLLRIYVENFWKEWALLMIEGALTTSHQNINSTHDINPMQNRKKTLGKLSKFMAKII